MGNAPPLTPTLGVEKMFRVWHEEFSVEVRLVRVSSLVPHEEIIERLVNKILNNILKIRKYTHPIIVDKNSFVILDGMHRFEAVKRLNCNYIPAELVNYNDDRIRVDRWWRVTEQYFSRRIINDLLSIDKNLEIGEPSDNVITIINRGETIGLKITGKKTIIDYYRIVNEIESYLRSKGIEYEYIKERNLNLEKIKKFFSFAGPKISKKDVIKYAKMGILFPPKSTCHYIPLRVYNLNIPLTVLREDGDEEMVNEIFYNIISKKKLKFFQGPCYIEGELREESCYIFEGGEI